ncbi:hypothetical protein DMR_30450 [Solidesulfovibrio magneticus RS-1]|uniref:Uncharacterized protein n=1 Tax=Solidesulfovibrio magneticus (strain ATCC 700980 / DSM 13731 / RS-1) TaxID=573370 RepID=C4XIG1_SOLM1|nr:hypothetical protein DMR_30450 [Solidesulfovibrio magneticus RS-1]
MLIHKLTENIVLMKMLEFIPMNSLRENYNNFLSSYDYTSEIYLNYINISRKA